MTGFRRLALVQSHPRIPAWHDYYIPDLVELCALAASVRELVDEVWIPVAPTDRDPLEGFARFLRRCRPDVVGISAFTCGFRSALDYAALAKRSGALVVMGGYHPTARPEEALACPDVDVVVRGEGEESLPELLRRGDPAGIAGLSYRRGGEVVHAPVRPPIPDLDALPLPLRELRPERCGLAGRDYHTDTVYASRGCRGRCVFCANHLIGGPWRPRSVESILAELAAIPPARGRRKHVKFWDSAFLADPGRVEALALGILEAGLQRHFRFVGETRAEDVVRAAPILDLMERAGFARIGCGVESPSRETHATLRKGLNLDNVGRAAGLLEAAGIQFTKFLIVGHEGEREADVLAYPDYALSHGTRLQKTTFFIMTPYPGTELDARLEAAGAIASRDWDLYMNFGAVVAPSGIGAERLQALHAAVALRYACLRRFRSGRPAAAVAAATLEPLFLLAKVELVRDPTRPATAIAARLHEALTLAACSEERPAAARRRLADRVGLRFHLAGHPTVRLRIARDGAAERLELGAPGDGEPRSGIPVSLERLVAIAARTDYRRLASDFFTLRRNPRAFRPAWAPGFAAGAARLLWGAARAISRPRAA